jgi:hypothetical protein
MRVVKVLLITTNEVLVGVPDELEIVESDGYAMIREPGSGITGPMVLIEPTTALKRGMLIKLDSQHSVSVSGQIKHD